MKLATVLRSLAAGIVVYVAMAACAASSSDHTAAPSSSATSAGGPDGAGTSASGGLADALLNPVSEASAAPETATEACDKPVTGSDFYYAEHLYPGTSTVDLAHVVVLRTPPGPKPLPGYAKTPEVPWVKDGAVAVFCQKDESIIFVR